jgi:hypothetical protein
LDRAPALYVATADAPPQAEIRARIRKLADEVLGPFAAPEHG